MRNRWMVTAAVVAGVWLAAPPAMAQQSDAEWLANCKDQNDRRFRLCEVKPVTVAATGTLRVDVRPNGGAQVTGRDQSTIDGSARIQVQADTEADARAIASRIVVGTSNGSLRADGPSTSDHQSWSVSFVLSVPRRTNLEIDAVNGPVAVTEVNGQIKVTTVNGPLSLTDLAGNVHARAINGPLKIRLAGASWDGEGLDAETRNGPVSMSVPDGYSAQLQVSTVNGPLRMGIPVTVQGELSRARSRSINTTIGGGGAPVRAATTNGPLSIEKR